MANIVLMQPSAGRFEMASVRIPLGLLAIASLPLRAGYTIEIVDQRLDREWKNTLSSSIGADTLCVGVTCSTGRMIDHALEMTRYIREISPETPIVWGGPHPTFVPDQTLNHPLADIVVINEADETFFQLVEALANKKPLTHIDGIGFKVNGEAKFNGTGPIIMDLDELPIFPYHLVDVPKYSSLSVDDLPSIDLLTSRGCPLNCAFCSVPQSSNRRWRAGTVDRLIEEIQFLKSTYSIRTFYFIDDNFMVDLKRVRAFVDALKANSLDIYWGTQGVTIGTINRMTTDLIDAVEESGCMEISVGVESADNEVLKTIEKRITVDDVFKANEKLVGKRFAVKYNLIIGFPGETMGGIRNTVKLAVDLHKRNHNAWFPVNIFTPYPGTALLKKAVEYGFVPPTHLEGWSRLESTGWCKYYKHWLSDLDNDLLESINFTSYLAFPSAFHRVTNSWLRFFIKLYQPFAFYRFSNMKYFLHIEKHLNFKDIA